MREIKFRGLGINDKKWYFGLPRQRAGYDYFLIEEINGVGHDIDSQTVGQYTGLKDKNGKEIYEGDILTTSSDGSGGVDVWGSEELGYAKVKMDTLTGTHIVDMDGMEWSWEDTDSVYGIQYLEVVGNIYELLNHQPEERNHE